MKNIALTFLLILSATSSIEKSAASTLTYSVKGTIPETGNLSDQFALGFRGQAFTSVISFDLDNASVIEPSSGNGGVGTIDGVGAAIDLSIGTSSFSFNAQKFTVSTFGSNLYFTSSYSPDPYNYQSLYLNVYLPFNTNGTNLLLETPLSSGVGGYQFTVGNAELGNTGGFAFLTPTSLSITSDVSAVPVPASLPLFGAALLGLGALGYGARRKTKTLAAG